MHRSAGVSSVLLSATPLEVTCMTCRCGRDLQFVREGGLAAVAPTPHFQGPAGHSGSYQGSSRHGDTGRNRKPAYPVRPYLEF
jgi:hypothetical protein